MNKKKTRRSRRYQMMGIMLFLLMGTGMYFYFSGKAGTKISVPLGDSLEQGLVGYWKLDEGTGTSTTADSSGNAITLSMTNLESGDWTTGQIGPYALDFDGVDEYLTVADNNLLDATDTDDFTLTGWFNRDTFTTDNTIVAKRNGQTSGDTGYVAYIDDSDDLFHFEVSDGSDEYELKSTNTFTATGWHSFVVTFDQDNANGSNLYIDGVSSNPTKTGTIGNIGDISNALAFRVGAESDAGVPFDGKLDDIRVYKRTFSSDEASRFHNTTSHANPDTSLVGHWTFDGNDTNWTSSTTGTVTDKSGKGNTGTMTNMSRSASPVPGKMGQGLLFDGSDDYVVVPDNTAFNFTSGTYSVWFKTTQSTKGNLLRRDDTIDRQFAFRIFDGGFLEFIAIWGGVVSSYSMVPVNDGKWHLGSATISYNDPNTTIVLYVDGVQVDTDMISGSMPAKSISLAIGVYNNWRLWGDELYFGTLDDVRIYNRALSASEVAGLYRETSAKVSTNVSPGDSLEQGLVGYWKLDEGAGTSTTADSSGNAITLTMTNLESGDWTAGQIGPYALDFDGTDEYLTVADNVILDATDTEDLTITGWFNRDTFTADNTIVAKRNGQTSGDTGYVAYIDDSDDLFHFEVSDGTDEYELKSTNTFTANGWHSFVAVFDQDNTNGSDLYIDGISSNPTKTGTIANIGDISNAVAFRVGAESDAGVPFDGKLDDIRVYKRTLSSDEAYRFHNTTSHANPDMSLVGHWTFDGSDTNWTSSTTGTVTDKSGKGNTGTMINMSRSTSPVPGKMGQGLKFDGSDDYVNAGSNTSFQLSLPVSISLWANPNSSFSGTRGILSSFKEAEPHSGFWMEIRDAGIIAIHYGSNLSCDFSSRRTKDSPSSSVVFGRWQHIVGVIRGETDMSIYINGADVGGTYSGSGGSIVYGSGFLRFGSTGGCSLSYFNGTLDDVRIYNRALSASEVASLYRETSAKVSTNVSPGDSLEQGLVGYWKLDEGSGNATDSSGNGNTATLYGSPSWTTGGVMGGALTFDGSDDYGSVPTTTFDSLGAMSISLWANPSNVNDDFLLLVHKGDTSGSTKGFGIAQSEINGKLVGFYQANYTTAEYGKRTSAVLSNGTWYHIIMTYDGRSTSDSGVKMYVNGLDASETRSGYDFGWIAVGGNNFNIGRRASNNEYKFSGTLDDVRIYSRALTPTEAYTLYNTTSHANPDTSLVGHWTFDGSDTNWTSSTTGTVTDKSGKGNTGTMTNMSRSTSPVPGKMGQGLMFDGSDDYVDVPNNTAFNFTSGTYSVWFKTTQSTKGNLLRRDDISSRQFAFRIFDGGFLEFIAIWGSYVSSYSRVPVNDGKWHLGTATISYNNPDTTIVLYVDGVQVDTDMISGSMPAASIQLDIGRYSFSPELYSGTLDDVRIYNRALSASEVASLYREGR